MEGISNEAASLAGHWGLGKLIAFYDDNHISIDGDTEIAFTESVDTRFEGLGWHVIWVKNGNTGYDEIRAAIKEAKAVTDRPTLIKVRYMLHSFQIVEYSTLGCDLKKQTIIYELLYLSLIYWKRSNSCGNCIIAQTALSLNLSKRASYMIFLYKCLFLEFKGNLI